MDIFSLMLLMESVETSGDDPPCSLLMTNSSLRRASSCIRSSFSLCPECSNFWMFRIRPRMSWACSRVYRDSGLDIFSSILVSRKIFRNCKTEIPKNMNIGLTKKTQHLKRIILINLSIYPIHTKCFFISLPCYLSLSSFFVSLFLFFGM